MLASRGLLTSLLASGLLCEHQVQMKMRRSYSGSEESSVSLV